MQAIASCITSVTMEPAFHPIINMLERTNDSYLNILFYLYCLDKPYSKHHIALKEQKCMHWLGDLSAVNSCPGYPFLSVLFLVFSIF